MAIVHNRYRGTKEYGLAYSALISAAHSGGMITYAGIARLTGLPDKGSVMAGRVGHLLGEISEDEVNQGRPMLSAVAVEKDTGLAGRGFFKLARKLNQLNGTSNTDMKNFLSKEKRKLYDFWR